MRKILFIIVIIVLASSVVYCIEAKLNHEKINFDFDNESLKSFSLVIEPTHQLRLGHFKADKNLNLLLDFDVSSSADFFGFTLKTSKFKFYYSTLSLAISPAYLFSIFVEEKSMVLGASLIQVNPLLYEKTLEGANYIHSYDLIVPRGPSILGLFGFEHKEGIIELKAYLRQTLYSTSFIKSIGLKVLSYKISYEETLSPKSFSVSRIVKNQSPEVIKKVDFELEKNQSSFTFSFANKTYSLPKFYGQSQKLSNSFDYQFKHPLFTLTRSETQTLDENKNLNLSSSSTIKTKIDNYNLQFNLSGEDAKIYTFSFKVGNEVFSLSGDTKNTWYLKIEHTFTYKQKYALTISFDSKQKLSFELRF